MHIAGKLLTLSSLLLCHFTTAEAQLQSARKAFVQPPDRYKPGVYWYFMDGNMSAGTMTKDLESMKQAGIGNLVFLEVNVGVPQGPVTFLSDEWVKLFAHAEKEARRLGIEITLGIGPGWTGSGGPWVRANQSMQHLVSSSTTVKAGGNQPIVLPVPPPKNPFFGEGGLTPDMKKEWLAYYEDVAVLAFPDTLQSPAITDHEEKALYYRAPFSSAVVRSFMPPPSTDRKAVNAIDRKKIIDLTGKLRKDGTLDWKPASGTWTIMRFVNRNNGAITRPAPFPGLGMEADKFDTVAMKAHLDQFVGKLINNLDKGPKTAGGLTRLHMDSWEMGAQNWTANFRKEFIKRRGYDPLKYYPVYSGLIVGNAEESERFLWDLRKTSQELAIENHAQYVKAYARRHGLELSIEPYDMTPMADLELGSVADVPMGEFWSKGFGFNSTYSVIEATSIGHVNGKSLIPAEAFTAQNNEGWKQHPGSMKNQGDWAFAAGINRFVYHTFQNQFLPDSLKPGATMGPYGIHWDRSQTWWPMATGYHDYVTRSQFLLQQGRTVADILYLTPEDAPHVFVPPASAIIGDTIGDRRGYSFDGCAPGQLMTATVQNGSIVFPGGARYQVLVLADFPAMTPALLQKIDQLVQQGATIAGNPPLRSPSLVNYPACDQQIIALSKKIWGATEVPSTTTKRKYGKGWIVWGSQFKAEGKSLFPAYESIADILKEKGLREDFVADTALRYTHRTGDGWDIYFVSNKTDKPVHTNAQFRTTQGAPEKWNAISGKTTPVSAYQKANDHTSVSIKLDAYESVFIAFAKENTWASTGLANPLPSQQVQALGGPWEVRFDPKWGGPASIRFNDLTDWTTHPEEGIKYYSGIATYRQQFEMKQAPKGPLFLELGEVKNMARVKLNGKDLGVIWTAPWSVDISSAIRNGKNDLEIEVVNLWANRLIGDEKKPYDGVAHGKFPEWLLKGLPRTSGRFTFTTTRQYNADSPLQPSGLIGPVYISTKP